MAVSVTGAQMVLAQVSDYPAQALEIPQVAVLDMAVQV